MNEIEQGAMAPDFALASAEGTRFRLAAQRGKRDIVLVFNRGFA